VVFLFHAFTGLFIGLLLATSWVLISIFEMNEIIPPFFGNLGKPTTSSILILLSSTAITLGILGAVIWSLLTLLYNIIAGFVRGIKLEVIANDVKEKGEQVDDE